VNSSARTTRSRRWTAVVVGGAAGAVLLGGGIALADGPGTDTAPSTTPDGGSTTGTPAPGGDRLVGTVTAVSEDSLTLTDDTGASHEVALTDQTRFGGPGAGGPGAGGPGAGGPGAGGPGSGGPAAPTDGSAPAAPAAPSDGSAPAAPSDGSAPAAPSDGSAPAAPSDGSAPAAPSDGSTPPAPGDGSAPAAPSDGSAPAAPSDGSTPPAPGEGATPPATGSADDIAVGDRVEVRVSDGTALDVHEVQATVDGTVVAVNGTDLTVVTTPGLRVAVDAGSLSALPSVGDDVHLHGTVSDDGRTVVADQATDGPR